MKKQLFLLGLLFGAHTITEAAATRKKMRTGTGKQKTSVSAPQLSNSLPLLKELAIALNTQDLSFDKSLEGNQEKQAALLKELRFASSEIKHRLFFMTAELQTMHVFKILCCMKDLNLNAEDPNGFTALSYAASLGNIDVVKLLLALKANYNHNENLEGNTPLMLALTNKHYDVASLLIKANANVEICNKKGSFPLYRAAENGNTNMVQQLLQAGAKANQTIDGYTPLHVALYNKHIETARTIIGPEATPEDWRFLQAAVDMESSEFVAILLARGADHTKPYDKKNNCLPLCQAIRLESAGIARQLLEAGTPTSHTGNPDCCLLTLAACKGSIELFDLLLHFGATANKGASVLYDETIYHGHIDLFQELIRRGIAGIDAIKAGNSILHCFASSQTANIKPMLDFLKMQPIDLKLLDIKNEEGAYPIHYACERKNIDVLQFLIELGVSINQPNDYGETPLYIAAREGNLNAVKLLTTMHANKKIKNILGLLPQEIAYANGHKVIAQHLYEHRPKKTIPTAFESQIAVISETNLDDTINDEIYPVEISSRNTASVACSSSSSELTDDALPHIRKKEPAQAKKTQPRYEDSTLFAMRQEEEQMSIVMYKHEKKALGIRLKNIRNMSGKQDKFHTFSPELDARISYGIYIDLQKADAADSSLLSDLNIKGDRGFAIIMHGKIEGTYYDVNYAKLDQGKRARGFIGAFVYLFDYDGKCYHRCFHENRESRQRHNALRPINID